MKLFLTILINFFMINILEASTENAISTSSGVVNGISKTKVTIYEDIPYAKPPVGFLRWKAPREITVPMEIFPKKDNFWFRFLFFIFFLVFANYSSY